MNAGKFPVWQIHPNLKAKVIGEFTRPTPNEPNPATAVVLGWVILKRRRQDQFRFWQVGDIDLGKTAGLGDQRGGHSRG